jgi:hypothetical protein
MIALVALAALICCAARGDEAKINTPVRTTELRGNWQLQPDGATEFKQTLHLGPGLTGQWQRSEPAHPFTLAWFVEGNELRILHYYEPDEPFNYRVKTLIVPYALSGDSLNLTLDGKSTTWKRTKAAAPARPSPVRRGDR